MKMGFFQDSKGDKSSKRLIAFCCFAIAVIIGLISLTLKQDIGIELVNSFLSAAVALLVGGTAAEQIETFSKKNKKNEYELE